MSQRTMDLLKQLRFVTMASNMFISKQKRLTGQARVLQVLNEEDGLIQSQLAEILDLRPSSLAELLKKMENNHTIIRQEDEQDRRLKRVYLTETGQQKIQRQLKDSQAQDRSEEFFAGLAESEQAELEHMLKKIMAAWDEKTQQQASRFVDPLDRLEQLKAFQQTFSDRFGTDWKHLSRVEQKELRRQMQQEMKDWPDLADGDFRQPFGFGGPRGFGPRTRWPQSKTNEKTNQEEWEDF